MNVTGGISVRRQPPARGHVGHGLRALVAARFPLTRTGEHNQSALHKLAASLDAGGEGLGPFADAGTDRSHLLTMKTSLTLWATGSHTRSSISILRLKIVSNATSAMKFADSVVLTSDCSEAVDLAL